MPARSRLRFAVVLVVLLTLAATTALLGLLAGETWLRTGDLGLFLSGEGSMWVRFVLEERWPRVAAAVIAGAALALAGTMVQATCRNPLAEPGILGITGGAGVGAVIIVTRGSTESASPTAVMLARPEEHTSELQSLM